MFIIYKGRSNSTEFPSVSDGVSESTLTPPSLQPRQTTPTSNVSPSGSLPSSPFCNSKDPQSSTQQTTSSSSSKKKDKLKTDEEEDSKGFLDLLHFIKAKND